MKKTIALVLSLMLVAIFAVGCSNGGDDAVTASPTAAATVETDNGNVTDDAVTDEANDAASDSIMDDMEDAVESGPSVEPTAENTENTEN